MQVYVAELKRNQVIARIHSIIINRAKSTNPFFTIGWLKHKFEFWEYTQKSHIDYCLQLFDRYPDNYQIILVEDIYIAVRSPNTLIPIRITYPSDS